MKNNNEVFITCQLNTNHIMLFQHKKYNEYTDKIVLYLQ